MKKLLPDSILLLGREVKIVEKAGLTSDGDSCDGLYDPENLIIFIDPSITDAHKFKIFCHECTHSYLSQLGLDQVIPKWAVECICMVAAMLVQDIVRAFNEKKK